MMGGEPASPDDRGPDTGQHVRRAGSEYLRHGDATPDGQVGAHPRARRADSEEVATFEDEYGVCWPTIDLNFCSPPRHGHFYAAVRPNPQSAERHFQACRLIRVTDEPVGERQAAGVQRAGMPHSR